LLELRPYILRALAIILNSALTLMPLMHAGITSFQNAAASQAGLLRPQYLENHNGQETCMLYQIVV